MSTEVCSVCLERESKYTCPACESKTCSLECVKRHKLRSECTGIVDPTRFVPNNDLGTNQALVNRDYNYLLNFERKINLGKSDLKDNAKQVFKRNFNQIKNVKRPRLNDTKEDDPRMDLVRKVFPNVMATSVKRENTLIIHLPVGMSRSSQNKSGYDKKSNAFTWSVEWVPFEDGASPKKSFVSFRLKESSLLKDAVPIPVLAKYMGTEVGEKDKLHFYLENCVSSHTLKVSLIPLSQDESLAAALKNKIVLEFPKIYVSLNEIENADFSGAHGYGLTPDSSEESSSASSSSESESELDSDSSSGTDSSLGSSESDSDEAPEEESSRPPERNLTFPEILRNEANVQAS
ncbi:hypothetical protein METBIDRAFT_44624 [Metschnikowia bicuspidata var. bicuspidata NRRL YB-4993]|uniref:HIT-type domain-containing protein n=1 Tax=Metschnikowia bicuspidata var. bicuspidata NRRL YB-4993 TaxID=869754 RepID=A0A1A0H852_9ASCO|nr:hypothetical protein METBIDRAFT_44624 [Metschnikowia bicuspidata var. bicuspidata NRRL YB-4993]OBA20073.1 hypothetical protein METBIDRAFT_44624 [Metschnikowia bicuspidata var. bicuspidata NRRL YB-4993]